VGGENVSNDLQSSLERADRGARAGINRDELRDRSAVLGNDNAFVTHATQKREAFSPEVRCTDRCHIRSLTNCGAWPLFPIDRKRQEHVAWNSTHGAVAGIDEEHAAGDDGAGTVE